MKTSELLNVFSPEENRGEIHPYDPDLSCGAGYIDDTFSAGEQPYPLTSEEQVVALVKDGAIDRR